MQAAEFTVGLVDGSETEKKTSLPELGAGQAGIPRKPGGGEVHNLSDSEHSL